MGSVKSPGGELHLGAGRATEAGMARLPLQHAESESVETTGRSRFKLM